MLLATRSTADAVERPSPVNLLRAAVTGIGENTQFQFDVVDDPSIKYFHLLIAKGRRDQR